MARIGEENRQAAKRRQWVKRDEERSLEGSEQERSIMIAGLRRELSLAAAKANSASLLDRVARIGEANRQAAKRRAWAKREEEKEQEERRAYWHAYVRGLGRRRGDIILY